MQLIRLYLPVLFPSWRFFAEIGASPRVAFRTESGTWQAATHRRDHVSVTQMLGRLLWNPDWTERLFWVSLAERYLEERDGEVLALLSRRVMLQYGLQSPPDLRITLKTGAGEELAFDSTHDA